MIMPRMGPIWATHGPNKSNATTMEDMSAKFFKGMRESENRIRAYAKLI